MSSKRKKNDSSDEESDEVDWQKRYLNMEKLCQKTENELKESHEEMETNRSELTEAAAKNEKLERELKHVNDKVLRFQSMMSAKGVIKWLEEEKRNDAIRKMPLDIKEAKIRLNGRLSLSENIAGNGGVKTAFNVGIQSLATEDEPALPGFQNFTSEQMFFLAYANNWCLVVRPKHYVQLVMADVHAPSKYRAIIPLQNRKEFSEAWKCRDGSMMNPRHKCQVWRWVFFLII
ncbi:unnamed protein product, partial [Mesorhabditis belari]|uniref:Peptidase M13 C-terminal domain-containing protein n=1 Tax=Mesorhabditis belari TaxID=2138241 RepID=A0AAF3FTT1_9BILA